MYIQMKIWSRSTLGIIVGAINILLCVLFSIALVINLIQINIDLRSDINLGINPERTKIFLRAANIILPIALLVCLVMKVLSSLLITGIVKRRHNLMAPWLILSAIGFICSILGLVFRIVVDVIFGYPVPLTIIDFIIGFVIIAIQYLILYKIYELYKDIRAKNLEQPPQMVWGTQMDFHNNYTKQLDNGLKGFHVLSEKY